MYVLACATIKLWCIYVGSLKNTKKKQGAQGDSSQQHLLLLFLSALQTSHAKCNDIPEWCTAKT